MVLYVCNQKKAGGRLPGPLAHPCGKAACALDDAGIEYEMKAVRGYRFVPWTRPHRKKDRAEVIRLSGKDQVPILVLDDGQVISGSGEIADWAAKQPRS